MSVNGFERIYKNVSAFKLDKYLKKWFKNNEDFITDLNKERLNEFGTNVEDEKLITYGGEGAGTGSYSTWTIEQKKKKGQPHRHVTVKDSGEAHDSMKSEADSSGFAVTMDENKPDGKISDNLDLESALGLSIKDIEILKTSLIEDLREDLITEFTQ